MKINSNQGQSKFDYQTFSMTVWSFIGQNCLQIKEAFARLFKNNDDNTIKKEKIFVRKELSDLDLICNASWVFQM